MQGELLTRMTLYPGRTVYADTRRLELEDAISKAKFSGDYRSSIIAKGQGAKLGSRETEQLMHGALMFFVRSQPCSTQLHPSSINHPCAEGSVLSGTKVIDPQHRP
jgi:hypothetical protein